MADEKGAKGAQSYWKANLRLITILLSIWALVSYVLGILLAPVLNNIFLGSLPVGFWFAQQGSIYIFVVLIFVYTRWMNRLDQDYGVKE